MTRKAILHLLTVVLFATMNIATARAATLGRTAEPTLAHLPSYVAHEKGLFRSEGLAVKMMPLTGRALISAGVKGKVDFVPIEGRGAQAILSGSRLKFIVGQSVMSHAVLAVRKNIKTLEDLKQKNIALGEIDGFRPEFLRPLIRLRYSSRWKFHEEPNEIARVKGLTDDVYQGVFVSPLFAAKAIQKGHRVLDKIGETRPYLSGTVWVRNTYLSKNRSNVTKFVRAIARGTQMIQQDKKAVVPIIMKYFSIIDPTEAGHIWEIVKGQFTPDIPPTLVDQLFRDRLELMARRGLKKIKTVPNTFDQYVARKLLSTTLKDLGYILRPPPYKRENAS
jgi:ABC-type nitrate/sulfonate/bicarbonate transport system substrate-binding protein